MTKYSMSLFDIIISIERRVALAGYWAVAIKISNYEMKHSKWPYTNDV